LEASGQLQAPAVVKTISNKNTDEHEFYLLVYVKEDGTIHNYRSVELAS
jgi:hypothetical protein